MKRSMLWLSAALLAVSFQMPAQPRRGGPPAGGQRGACCDQNKDGVCDRCGKQAGSGQGRRARGCGRGQNQNTPPPAQPAPNK
jgi:hypothetical protein